MHYRSPRRRSRSSSGRDLLRLMIATVLFVAVVYVTWTSNHPGAPVRGVTGPGRGPAGTAQRIEITDRAWRHIIDRHTPGGAMSAGKSVFNSGEDIRALIIEAERVAPIPESGGRLKRVVDAGRYIGTDRSTGRQTSTYIVITEQSGELVTAYPIVVR